MKKVEVFKEFGLLLSGLFIFHAAHSQENFIPGYIVKNNNDTLFGWVDYRNWKKNPDHIVFKVSIEANPHSYTQHEITEFGVEEEIYVSAIIETEVSPLQIEKLKNESSPNVIPDTAFLQVLFRGNKSLLFYKNKESKENFYIENDSGFELLIYKKYLEQQNGKNLVLENKKYLGQLNFYLNDCETINSKLKNTSYDQKSLMELFMYYNKCTPSDIYFQKQIDRIKIETGILAGVSRTTLDFRSESFEVLVNAAYKPSINFTTGLYFDLILPRNQSKWSVNNEILFNTFKVDDIYEKFVHENQYSITTTELGYSYLKLNNMLRFKYPMGLMFIFINGGISNGFVVSETNYKKTESTFYSTKEVEEGLALDDPRKYEQGFLLGTGAKYNKFSLELRYENGTGMSKQINLKSAINRYYFLFGYRF